ncbi:MAG: Na+/H+ antiporter NhaA [Haliea sp.]|nr:Na+/H+ antiporter NhaA [Haliea sp.]
MLTSGVHSTIAGIIVAFVIPIRPKFEPELFVERVKETSVKMLNSITDQADIIKNSQFRSLVTSLGDGVRLVQAPAQRLEHTLHLPVAYLVIPIFALANAGIPVNFSGFAQNFQHPVMLGYWPGSCWANPSASRDLPGWRSKWVGRPCRRGWI